MTPDEALVIGRRASMHDCEHQTSLYVNALQSLTAEVERLRERYANLRVVAEDSLLHPMLPHAVKEDIQAALRMTDG